MPDEGTEMPITIITPPASEPVTTAELKDFARVDGADEDTLIAALGTAAREFVETATGRALMTQTLELTERCFPSTIIALARPPLQSVTSIKYRDADGVVQTLDSGAYIVDTAGGTVEPVTSWPGTGVYPDAVQIRYVAGYASASDVPEGLKLITKSLATFWHGQREPVATGEGLTRRVPMHVRSMLHQNKRWGAA